jgi:hypothetical protein
MPYTLLLIRLLHAVSYTFLIFGTIFQKIKLLLIIKVMKKIANTACTTGLTSSYLEFQDYQGLSCAAQNSNGGPNCELYFL